MPKKSDPTGTGKIRRRNTSSVRKRWVRLKKALVRAARSGNLTTKRAVADWFRSNAADMLLDGATSPNSFWMRSNVLRAYKRGIQDAYNGFHSAGGTSGLTKAGLTRTLMGRQLRIYQVVNRGFLNLQDVLREGADEVSRLVQLARENNISDAKLADAINRRLDVLFNKRIARTARTEVVWAYNEAVLDGLAHLGVTQVVAWVEWTTAGDDRVCPLCEPLEGEVFTIAQARNMLPRHPDCRCAWTPVLAETENTPDAREAIKQSIQAEAPKRSYRTARRRSSWEGARRALGVRGTRGPVATRRSRLQISPRRRRSGRQTGTATSPNVVDTKVIPDKTPKFATEQEARAYLNQRRVVVLLNESSLPNLQRVANYVDDVLRRFVRIQDYLSSGREVSTVADTLLDIGQAIGESFYKHGLAEARITEWRLLSSPYTDAGNPLTQLPFDAIVGSPESLFEQAFAIYIRPAYARGELPVDLESYFDSLLRSRE